MAVATRRIVGWTLLVGAVAASVIVGVLPSPYAIESPGPVFDTLGSTTVNGKSVPLIEIPDAKTYPTRGQLDLLTVSVQGSPDTRVGWGTVLSSWFNSADAVVPLDELYAPGTTSKELNEQSEAQMTSSQQEAIAAAERELGYTVPGVVTVGQVVAGGAASGVLQTGDVILSVNGTAVSDAAGLRAAIAATPAGQPVGIAIRRGSTSSTVEITPKLQNDGSGTQRRIIGIVPGASYDFPVTVKIQLDNVGGPSAGMMFALGIIDKLTSGSLTGGAHVAGTGTIASSGAVGAIGGIRQKLIGARKAGASWFLAPAGNCNEVVGHVPSGLRVVKVSTLSQARTALSAIASGQTASLPTCAAGS